MGKLITFARPVQSAPVGFAVDSRCSQNIVLLCTTAYAAIVAAYAIVYPSALSGKSYVLTAVAIIPILIGMMYSNSIAPFGKADAKTIGAWAVALAIILYLGVMAYATPIKMQIISVSSVGFNIAVIGIALVSAAALFNIFANYLRSLQNVPKIGIFFRILFFIPCLISDAAVALKTQFRLTTRPIAILLAVDLILICLYMAMPFILGAISKAYGTRKWLSSVAYLDRATVLLKNLTSIRYVDTHRIHSEGSANIFYKIREIYAIGFWVFITPQNLSGTSRINILTYGPPSTSTGTQAPVSMVYNPTTFLYEISLAQYGTEGVLVNKPQTLSNTEIIPQAWNYIVLNYTETSAEIFVNGVVERAINFGESEAAGATEVAERYFRPVYTETDTVVVGEKEGLYGAIHEVVYHPTSLSAGQIAAIYAYSRLFSLPEIPV